MVLVEETAVAVELSGLILMLDMPYTVLETTKVLEHQQLIAINVTLCIAAFKNSHFTTEQTPGSALYITAYMYAVAAVTKKHQGVCRLWLGKQSASRCGSCKCPICSDEVDSKRLQQS